MKEEDGLRRGYVKNTNTVGYHRSRLCHMSVCLLKIQFKWEGWAQFVKRTELFKC